MNVRISKPHCGVCVGAAGVEERINLRRDGQNAKPYQVKQVRAVILKYRLGDIP